MTPETILDMAGVEAEHVATYPIDANRNAYTFKVDDESALETARKLAAVSEQTGYSPLFSQEDFIDRKLKQSEYYMKEWENNIENVIASVPLMQADLADPAQLLAKMRPGSDPAALKRAQNNIARLITHSKLARKGESLTECSIKTADVIDLTSWLVEMTEDYELDSYESDFDHPYVTKVATLDRLVLLPVAKPWQIPSVLIFTGRDVVPISLIQVPLLKRWYDNYGATLISLNHDTAHFEVARPPAAGKEADQLALEHFAYCQDVVLQGMGIKQLARGLTTAKAWGFWWD